MDGYRNLIPSPSDDEFSDDEIPHDPCYRSNRVTRGSDHGSMSPHEFPPAPAPDLPKVQKPKTFKQKFDDAQIALKESAKTETDLREEIDVLRTLCRIGEQKGAENLILKERFNNAQTQMDRERRTYEEKLRLVQNEHVRERDANQEKCDTADRVLRLWDHKTNEEAETTAKRARHVDPDAI